MWVGYTCLCRAGADTRSRPRPTDPMKFAVHSVPEQPLPAIQRRPGGTMLQWAAVFFIIAIVAALLGFTGIAAGAAGIAKVLFVVFLVVAIVTLLIGRGRYRGPGL